MGYINRVENWEVHSFQGLHPTALGKVISNIRGNVPKRLIIDVEPQILELRSHGLDDLRHSCCDMLSRDTKIFVSKLRIQDSMSPKLRQSIKLQNELLEDLFDHRLCDEDRNPNDILEHWIDCMEL